MSDQTPQYGSQQQPPAQPGYPQQPGYQQPGYPQQSPYQQPGYQQQYGQPVYQQTVVYTSYQPQPKGFSVTSLVLGIASVLFGFTFLVPIGAVIFGIVGIRREPTAKGMSITGLILGAVMLVGWIILLVLWLSLAFWAVGAASVYGTTS